MAKIDISLKTSAININERSDKILLTSWAQYKWDSLQSKHVECQRFLAFRYSWNGRNDAKLWHPNFLGYCIQHKWAAFRVEMALKSLEYK